MEEKLFKNYIKKSFEERKNYLTSLNKEAKMLLLEQLAENMGVDKEVSLEDFLELEMAHRVMMTPSILSQEPVFQLEVFADGVQLEKKTSGGGRFGRDRKFHTFEKGVHTLGFKAALVLIETYGEHVEFLSTRNKVREKHAARELRIQSQNQKPQNNNSKNQR